MRRTCPHPGARRPIRASRHGTVHARRRTDGSFKLSVDGSPPRPAYAGTTMEFREHSTVVVALRLCLYALLAGLLVLAAVRAGDSAHPVAVVAAVLGMGAVFTAGAVSPRVN